MQKKEQTAPDTRPLAGLKVIDMTHVLAGPACTYLLAQMGAEVIKIEEPGGDTVRNRGGSIQAFKERGMGTNYLAQNAGKKSIVIDVHTDDGRTLVRNLVNDAQVFVENRRGKTLSRIGLGPKDLMQLNPGLIYCSMSGYGHDGPLKNAPAYDVNIQAASGIMSITGTPENAPVRTGAPIMDYATGLSAAFAISAAIIQRNATGQGQFIDVSMLDTALYLMSSTVTDYLTSGNIPRPKGNSASSGIPTSGNFQTRGGILSLGINEDHQFHRFAQAVERPDLLTDKRYSTFAARQENADSIINEVSKILLSRSAEEWEDILISNGVPAARVNTLPEILNSKQVRQRNLLKTFDTIEGLDGSATVIKAPFKYAGDNGPRLDSPPPKMGQDTVDILEKAGYTRQQIAALRETNIVA